MEEFYQFYLGEHQNKVCRRLHFFGTLLAILSLIVLIAIRRYQFLYIPFVCGYLPAWIGHFFFEKNRPATFKAPVKSLICDFRMFFDILRGKISW